MVCEAQDLCYKNPVLNHVSVNNPFASIVIKSTEIDDSVKMFTIIVRHVKLIKNIFPQYP